MSNYRFFLYNRYILIFLFISLVSSGCNDNPADNPEANKTIQPLAVGNYWMHSAKSNEGAYRFDTSKTEIIDTISIFIEGQNHHSFISSFSYINPITIPFERYFFWNGADGLYRMGAVAFSTKLLLKELYLKYPAEVGESWQVFNYYYDWRDQQFKFFENITMTLSAKNKLYQSKAGAFNCYVYSYRKEGLEYFLYYSPGVGKVAEIEKSNLGITSERNLLEYSVK